MNVPTIAERIEHRIQDEVHDCVVSACGERARTTYHVDDSLRLAGRDWHRGDFVDLCPAHTHELHRTITDAIAAGFVDLRFNEEDPLRVGRLAIRPGPACMSSFLDAYDHAQDPYRAPPLPVNPLERRLGRRGAPDQPDR